MQWRSSRYQRRNISTSVAYDASFYGLPNDLGASVHHVTDAQELRAKAGSAWYMITPVTAFVLIDAQQGLLDDEAGIPDAAAVLDRLVGLLAAARSAGTLIIHLQNDGAAGSLDEPGTPGWFIHPKVAPEPGEVVLRKVRDDGFDGTVLEDVLAHEGVTRIAVAGLLSEMCVSATVRSALVQGLQVVLIHDAHATYNLDDIPASIVARVAEHALGDEVELADAVSVAFGRPSQYGTKHAGTERGFDSTRGKFNDR